MMYSLETYKIQDAENIVSPQLIYYEDLVRKNTEETIRMANGVKRLWPHVKTHKSKDMIALLQEYGLQRFKCATIAEGEMLGNCQVREVVVAYPLVGPNIERFMVLQERFPETRYYAMHENVEVLEQIAEASKKHGRITKVMLDVNVGMARTGVRLDRCVELYRQAKDIDGIEIAGLHCYNGHHNDPSRAVRQEAVNALMEDLRSVVTELKKEGMEHPIVIVAGTPETPCFKEFTDEWLYVSPGTVFLYDWGCDHQYDDIRLTPAGLVLGRVISHPDDGLFTIDVGCKAIAADPVGVRGVIVGYEEKVKPVLQNEEHWVFEMLPGKEAERPAIGQVVYVVPSHICPTSAWYPKALIVRDGRVAGEWTITARDRKLTI